MDAQTLFNQAVAAIKAKKNGEAQKLLMEVVRQNPRHEQAWLALASVLTDMHQAADCLRRVLALNPNNATAKEWLAFAEKEIAREAAVAEMRTTPLMADVPIEEPGDEERPVPRLGKYLLDYKFITEAQLKAALIAQRDSAKAGKAKRLGDILLEQGAITEERLSFAVREQHRSFYSLFND
jgi:thioredoxin-like negative regulator of GroEL